MEGAGPTTRERTTGLDGSQGAENMMVMSSKPLHRFVQKEPRSLGIAVVIIGFTELVMGFILTSDSVNNSGHIYIPFWQGALFLLCGNLSIYTELHPSKKMVTVCLSMYVVSLAGTIISVGYRIACLSHMGWVRWNQEQVLFDYEWATMRLDELFCSEVLLLTFSLCVAVILIFLSTTARLALKSTHTQQVVVQWNPAAPAHTGTTSTNTS